MEHALPGRPMHPKKYAGQIREEVEKLFKDQPDHHGIKHIRNVYVHAQWAVHANKHLDHDHREIIYAAALLHDADDGKLFPGSGDFENARAILEKVGFPEEWEDLVIESISLVSCSSQGSHPEPPEGKRWLLIPRDADRLDALGHWGFERCLSYSTSKGMPLHVETTLLPKTKEQLLACLDPEKFEKYKAGAKSRSIIDHFFDKLLHLSCNDSGNPYFTHKAPLARDDMISDLLQLIATI